METRHSVCALDCPDTCSLLINVDEAGRGSKLRGNPDHPITRGFLCGKVARYLEHEYHPDRLLYPMRRSGPKGSGQFERISWDDALDETTRRLLAIAAEHGSEAILPYSYAGTMGLLNGSGMDRRFFHRLGASRLNRTICSAAGGTALMLSQGARLGTEPEQFQHSRLIIAWGANVLGTNVHLWPWIVEARRRGARFYVIDPIRNRTAAAADRHFPICPGSDLALALGMIHVILKNGWHDGEYITQYTSGFQDLADLAHDYTPQRVSDLTGLPANDVELLATEYATMRPAAIRVNYGVQRSDRGGAAIRAISALPVITGSWRELGGGLQLTLSGAFEFNRGALERPDLQERSSLGRQTRVVNMSQLGSALTALRDPPVHALVVYNSNPATVAPDQTRVIAGLRRSDLFTVVLEHFLTDTARYADIVLPATTFLEHTDLYLAYGHYYLQLARPALPAPGECRSNVAIFRDLALRAGFTEDCFQDSEDSMIRQLLDTASPYLQGITFEQLEEQKFIRLSVSPAGQPFLPFARGGFHTHDGRFQFGASHLHYVPPVESRGGNQDLRARFPLELISSKNDNSMNSTFGNRSGMDDELNEILIHPEDAAPRDVCNGATVRVFNHRGACSLRARISTTVRPGVVSTRSMRWNAEPDCDGSPRKLGINQLVSERLTDLGDGPTFFSCLVEVEQARRQPREDSNAQLVADSLA